MGSKVSICNATNLPLNLALSQAGPLFYENNVKPGECWEKEVGKVWFTINASLYTGEENIYTDWSVAKPIVTWSLMGIGAAATLGGAIPTMSAGLASASLGAMGGLGSLATMETASMISIGSAATLVNTFVSGAGGAAALGTMGVGIGTTVGGAVMEFSPAHVVQIVNEKLTISSAGWYMGEDRTIYICGGPPKSDVKSNGDDKIMLHVGPDVEPIYLTEEKPQGFTVTRCR